MKTIWIITVVNWSRECLGLDWINQNNSNYFGYENVVQEATFPQVMKCLLI